MGLSITGAAKLGKIPLLDQITAIRDDLDANPSAYRIKSYVPGEISEAFARLDPDLAYLYKDMKTAAIQLEQAQRSGQVVDMAQWRFETAESAYQTRLLEVRSNENAKLAMQRLEEGEEELAVRRALRDETMQKDMNEAFARQRKKREEAKRRAEEKNNGWMLIFLLGWAFMQMQARMRARELELSRLQHDFFNAQAA